VILASLALAAATASLQVHVTGGARPLELVLRRVDERGSTSDVASKRLASASTIFVGIERGSYILIASGSDPLARQAVRVRVDDAAPQRVNLHIAPRRVEGTVLWGRHPLADVTLNFRHDELGWTGSVISDAKGRFASELWQPGSYAVGVSRGALHNTYGLHATLRGGPVTLVVPAREIRGRVVDAATRRGIADAQVILRTQRETSAATIGQRTGADGSFLFDAVAAGPQRLTVMADDFLIPDPVELTIGENDAPAEITVPLDAGRARSLRVFDHRGAPVTGAEVIAASGNRVRATSQTGADGRVSVAVPAEEVVLYVVAPGGGFAVLDRQADRVDLPAPRSSLRLIARAAFGDPLPPISFIVSIDGRVIPPAVAQRMSRLQGFSLRTDERGEVNVANIPPGFYQFWPYDGEAERDMILAAPYEAPIAVNVKSGPNAIAVDFQPKTLRTAAPPR